jgi:hypothetical protein
VLTESSSNTNSVSFVSSTRGVGFECPAGNEPDVRQRDFGETRQAMTSRLLRLQADVIPILVKG